MAHEVAAIPLNHVNISTSDSHYFTLQKTQVQFTKSKLRTPVIIFNNLFLGTERGKESVIINN